ncbi:TetR/AcrR family transcriptional regulator [Novibacillus thermophilus]|uniref:TetR family transcriptional regulator n=1 Tax=Novibacillus thermophilus TaxID=1471761 RepID=A0A1U9K3K5_9BACL|nr:TetR/AcrR family transcriptional regulator [Novibacillus thermophilus]AQS54617.1 TetR family transcriptional regulator [Novibacillus thermophilus]
MATSKGQKKRDFILEKAKELFIQKGYAGTSMEDLVQYSGVSKGSIYYHFDSKEDLFLNVIEKDTKEWLASWREKERRYTSFAEKLYGIADHYAEDFHNPLQKVAEEFMFSQPIQTELLDHALMTIRTKREEYANIFRDAIEAGEIEAGSPEELSFIFSGLMDGLSTLYYVKSQDELKLLYKQAITYFLKGVIPR